MNNLYNAIDNAHLITRLNRLTATTSPFWGKMSAAQMMAHCQVPLQIGFGEIIINRGLIGYLFGGIAKKQLMSPKPFARNLPTFKEAKITYQPDFDTEKHKLTAYISRLAIGGPEGITKLTHPIFGKLTTTEWNALQYKHLDHHFQQFGL